MLYTRWAGSIGEICNTVILHLAAYVEKLLRLCLVSEPAVTYGHYYLLHGKIIASSGTVLPGSFGIG